MLYKAQHRGPASLADRPPSVKWPTVFQEHGLCKAALGKVPRARSKYTCKQSIKKCQVRLLVDRKSPMKSMGYERRSK